MCNFYSASAMLAVQSAVLAKGILSVCLSVSFRYCVQTNEESVVFSLLRRKVYPDIRRGSPPAGTLK